MHLRDLVPDIDEEWKGWLGPSYNFKGMWYNDGIYVVAQDVWTEAVWYHKDMLQEIGVDTPASTDAFTVAELAAMVGPATIKVTNSFQLVSLRHGVILTHFSISYINNNQVKHQIW